MSSRSSLAVIPRTKAGLVALAGALFILSIVLQYVAAVQPRAALAADAPVVTLEDGVNGCMGVLPTPGSENTNKRLIGGSLEPGGTATFEISYPVDPEDVAGRTTFVITDCVFIDGKAALKYSVSFVPNTVNFVLTFTLQIPAGTPLGAEYCNYAKTTAAPSSSQASNRKAGPACFVVGGNISILKTNEAGDPLAGATFHIVCTLPTTNASMPDTIIDGVTYTSTSGKVITTDATTGDDGRIVIQAPEGTSCVITETDPPDGYDLPADPSVTLVASSDGATHTFVDPPAFVPAPGLSIDKGVSLSADGPFTASLTTEVGTTVYYEITVTNTGNVELTGVTLSDSLTDLVGAGCTIPTSLAVGASFSCDYSNTAAAGETVNTATADSEQTEPSDDTATVTGTTTPGLQIRKAVGLSADGPFINVLNVAPGTTVFYHITVTNTGDVELTGVTLSDDTFDLVAKGCTIPTTLAVGASFDCDYSSVSAETSTVNTATADSNETGPESDSATVNPVAQQLTPVLSIDKSNDAPAAPDGAAEGDTVTYTIDYTITDGPADAGVIKDVLPEGVTYVDGSATDSDNGEFVFDGYDSATRTLTWLATQVSENDSVSYKVTVDTGAAALEQPLENQACIVATGAAQVCDTSDVFVAPPPAAETSVPKTPPPTDVAGTTDSNASGGSMLFILLGLVGLGMALVFVAPTPAAIRKRR
ncbi:MAG TPA: isopeptide-forming domain-containing fimbrial protein [Candidatus Limnocylindrales bacterium]|jgi:fimbrial isopeptide formation D2 family protein|nr:isopeptide-forming domain-containing fimbrial protein [Candidatus Limnocylindrales bacterium]